MSKELIKEKNIANAKRTDQNTEKEAAELAEDVFKILQNRIAIMEKIPDDVLESFRSVVSARVGWLAQISKLKDTDPVKKAFKKAFWLEIEFGILSNIEIDAFDKEELKGEIVDQLEYNNRLSVYPKFLDNPYDIFNGKISEDVLPMPNGKIKYDWDPKTLTVRYYYHGPPKPEDDWEELIKKWWNSWDVSYGESNPMLTIEQQDNESENVFDFIAKIRLYDGTCFTLGQSLFEPKATDINCEQINRW